MNFSRWMLGIACVLYVFSSVTAHAATSDASFAQGNAFLCEGKFEQALQAYAAAVRSDRAN
ncbi:MAG: hypothetical protein JW829_05130 [Pirellulales bacterium]|nr:hypothetical protein [Pirellulales bacterium]